jgi:hypothetical protein
MENLIVIKESLAKRIMDAGLERLSVNLSLEKRPTSTTLC